MEITVNINAPAIVDALNNFTVAVTTILKAPQATTLETAVAPAPAPVVFKAPQATTLETAVASVAPAPAVTAAPAPVVSAAPAPAAPVVDEAYRNRVCQAAARLVEAGKMNDILNALKSFNVAAVTQLSPEQLPAFAAQITALGAVV